MKKLILTSIITFGYAFFGYSNVMACTVLPLDPVEETEKIIPNVLGIYALNEDHNDLRTVIISQPQADFIWTPMCPKGKFVDGVYTIKLKSNNNCQIKVHVRYTLIYGQEPKVKTDELNNTCNF